MTLKQFIYNLNDFVKENPETLDMQLLVPSDSEGNSFYPPFLITPLKGFYDGIRFISYEDYEYLSINNDQTNAVAIV